MIIAALISSLYLFIGIGVAVWLYEPERNGILWRILLWPLEIAARIVP